MSLYLDTDTEQNKRSCLCPLLSKGKSFFMWILAHKLFNLKIKNVLKNAVRHEDNEQNDNCRVDIYQKLFDQQADLFFILQYKTRGEKQEVIKVVIVLDPWPCWKVFFLLLLCKSGPESTQQLCGRDKVKLFLDLHVWSGNRVLKEPLTS